MPKIDLKKELKHLYRPSATDFVVVDVPPMDFLMIDSHGDPNEAREYQDALEALYAVAYKMKFLSRNEVGTDYVVPPLEGLWWADDMASFTSARDKRDWDWTMMILTPEWVGCDVYERATAEVLEKKDLPALSKLRLETYNEGPAAQIMHVGSFDDEAPTLARLHDEWLPEHGCVENGRHHEIYLSDPRRTEPAKLRTVLRQPIREA